MKKIALLLIFFMMLAGFVEAQSTFPSMRFVRWVTFAPQPKRGQLKLIEFWATWCPPCRKSIPHLNRLHQKYKSKGLVVIGISNESPARIRQFRRKFRMAYHVGSSTNLIRKLRIRGIPHAYLVKNGRILWQGHPLRIDHKLISKHLNVGAQAFPGFGQVIWLGKTPKLRKKQLKLIEFWATWCPPCRKSIPHLNRLHRKFAKRGLIVIGLSSEKIRSIQRFRKRYQMNYYVGRESQIVKALKVRMIPKAFLVKKGKILWSGHPSQIKEKLIERFLYK